MESMGPAIVVRLLRLGSCFCFLAKMAPRADLVPCSSRLPHLTRLPPLPHTRTQTHTHALMPADTHKHVLLQNNSVCLDYVPGLVKE